MTDIVDAAQEREAAYLEERLRAQADSAALGRAGSGICADCGEAIPAARRRALPSAIRCVDCQAWHERRGEAMNNKKGTP